MGYAYMHWNIIAARQGRDGTITPSVTFKHAKFIVTNFSVLCLQPCQCPESLKTRLLECLNETVYFDEIALAFTRMQTDVRDFLACLKQEGINLETMFPTK